MVSAEKLLHCSKCKLMKLESNFHVDNRGNARGRLSACIDCRRGPNLARKRLCREENRKRILALMQVHNIPLQCRDCGCKNLDILDWHHVDPKSKLINIGNMINCRKWETIEHLIVPEVPKCVFLCKICHSLEASYTSENKLALWKSEVFRLLKENPEWIQEYLDLIHVRGGVA